MRFVYLVIALCIAAACGGDNKNPIAPTPVPAPTPAPTPTPPTPKELFIRAPEGFSGELMPLEPVQFYAALEYSDGSVREGVSAEWSSSDTTVATVSESGLVTGRQPGTFNLTARAEGLTSTHEGLLVVPAPAPPPTPRALYVRNAGFPDEYFSELTAGDTAQFRADLEYSDGSVREGVSAEWSSSDTTVATVSESGLVTARQPGVFDLTASAEGLTSTHDGLLVVPAPPPPLPPRPALPPRPVDPRFNDLFWSQLVFNQFDAPGQRYKISVLENPCLNVYIRLGDSTGQRRIVSDAIRDHITQAVPQLAYQLTGQPYGCRIESGMEDRTQAGWMTVRFFADGSSERTSASLGTDPGNIWIWLGYTDGRERFGALFPRVFAHEFGHAMGFWHVAETAGMPKSVMARAVSQENPGSATFTAAEQYHAQLAYEIGRGREYCGWPFQEVCATPRNQGAAWVPSHVVID